MRTVLHVLSEEEKTRVHERTLGVLAKTGVRVDTAGGRRMLRDAGADVVENTHIVRFPRALVEEALRLAPKRFVLGARRPGWDLPMNAGHCTLLMDGEATMILDRKTGERRPGTFQDWLESTRLGDVLDQIGIYWSMIRASDRSDTIEDYIEYLRNLFGNFSKHVQDAIASPEQATWLLKVLQVIFGDKERVRRHHPLSFLLCPQSPLIIDEFHTDAYLALLDWDIPVAAMPMPFMGATAPGSLISTVILGNCEVLATLCLVQAAAPGTPFIFAPNLTLVDLRSGLYASGAVENALFGAAVAEMGRYYGLPVEASGFSTGAHVPSIQAGYERALTAILPVLAWPDILVGPGLLAGAMVLSLEQMVIDVEIFGMCKQARRGILCDEGKWLDDVIDKVGPGGDFLSDISTVRAARDGEWHIGGLGAHDSFETWRDAGKPTVLDEAREKVDRLLTTHEPISFDATVEAELDRISQWVREK